MFCWNCGKKNPEENKYCGACGKSLSPVREEVREPAVVASAVREIHRTSPPVNPMVEEPHAVRERIVPPPVMPELERPAPARAVPTPAPETQHRISGPSFLGIGQDADESDYLLEEDEPRSSWRGWLTLIIFAMIALLVWKQWSVIRDSARAYGERAGVLAPSRSRPAQTPAQGTVNPPAAVSAGNITVNDDAAQPVAKETQDSKPVPEDKSLPLPPKAKEKARHSQADEEASLDEPPAPSTPAPSNQDSQVELAQRYVQGRGVAQDCARGMSLLRSAAGKASTKARIQLGALYATGQCVTQDNAAAYRWFAQAQELEPGNSYVNRNMNLLWAKMSAEEKRRAEAQ